MMNVVGRGVAALGMVWLAGCAAPPTLPPLVDSWQRHQARGVELQRLGDLERARTSYQRALMTAELTDDQQAMIQALLARGSVDRMLGDYAAAREAYGRVSRLAKGPGRKRAWIRAEVGRAETDRSDGRVQQARQMLERLAATPAVMAEPALAARIQLDLALVAFALDEDAVVPRHLDAAAILARGNPGLEAAVLLNRAQWVLRRDDPAAADRDATEALAIYRALREPPGVAAGLTVRGAAQEALGEIGEARRLYGQALRIYRYTGQQVEALRLSARLDRIAD